MGNIRAPRAARLVASYIYRDTEALAEAERLMEHRFGSVSDEAFEAPFDLTDYYRDEFGDGLRRKLVAFDVPVDPAEAADIKIYSNSVEDSLRRDGRRTVNIDPGYVTDAKLVLLTTKDYSHRVYLGKGIYAEVTLRFGGSSFGPWPWTYPDYSSEAMVGYFNRVRKAYMSCQRGKGSDAVQA